MEDYHTHHLGKAKDGRLFWGYLTFFFPEDIPHLERGIHNRRDYTVFHIFDSEGNLLETKYQFAGTADIADDEQAELQLNQWVAELGETEYCDIEVKLFQTTIDGVEFGLIPSIEFELLNLEPSATISFAEPWDGEYYT